MSAVRTSSPGILWAVLVGSWSLIFAAPHFYWAVGGRAGLENQAAAADVALQQGWFAAYNLAAGCLGILGALVALGLAKRWGSRRARRWLLGAATAACSVLLLRGLLGLTLLGVGLLTGTFDQQTPAVLLAIEPWFVVGGIAYGALVVDSAGCPDRHPTSLTDPHLRPTTCQLPTHS
ncbi:MAG: DUF3995 domain-containing protein [Pseudonocardiales bacterium]|nr:DUF3995 domain-containing protein [Pseudonocardiales bacterium]